MGTICTQARARGEVSSALVRSPLARDAPDGTAPRAEHRADDPGLGAISTPGAEPPHQFAR